jgi:hypothetical protein
VHTERQNKADQGATKRRSVEVTRVCEVMALCIDFIFTNT